MEQKQEQPKRRTVHIQTYEGRAVRVAWPVESIDALLAVLDRAIEDGCDLADVKVQIVGTTPGSGRASLISGPDGRPRITPNLVAIVMWQIGGGHPRTVVAGLPHQSLADLMEKLKGESGQEEPAPDPDLPDAPGMPE